jgi:hypothetical protein
MRKGTPESLHEAFEFAGCSPASSPFYDYE